MHIHKWSEWRLVKSSLGWQYNRKWRECVKCGERREKYIIKPHD